MQAPVIVGVRHFSPACARLVAATVRRVRPRVVLVEGPADMGDRMGELLLPHTLPIAIFSSIMDADGTRSSWSPFCAHSPEWVALQTGREAGAALRFMDLPSWHPAFHEIRNRYADRDLRAGRIVERLLTRFGMSDPDALWDHLFEQPQELADLERGLRLYFQELRGDEPPGERDRPREEFMARCLAAAVAEGGGVVAVCGGWHAPALEAAWRAAEPTWPEIPAPEPGARGGSFLVPYSFARLDSFAGYEAGMPSPAYQDAVFHGGPASAADRLLAGAVARLRARKQAVSAADMIAVATLAEGLRRLRGHAALGRIDLLDGLAGGLVKDALEAPLPWTYRGPLHPRTEPLLAEVMAVFAGDLVGSLAPGTPRPPLVDDVRAELHAHGVPFGPERADVEADLADPGGLARSRVLHRVRVLGVPGFTRTAGPAWATDGQLRERWTVQEQWETTAALIEAGAYGATLAGAAAARLAEALLAAGGRLGDLARLLGDCVFVGIGLLAERVLAAVAAQVGQESDLGALGEAQHRLLALYRHDTLLGSAGSELLAVVLREAFARGLWLVEGVRGAMAPADPGLVGTLLALRDTLRLAGGRLGLEAVAAHAVMRRRSADPEAPPTLRGAALGFLWATGAFATAEEGAEVGVRSVRGAASPHVLGDHLVGLFALAREEARTAPGVLAAIDDTLAGMDDHQFQVALPSLRLAFGFFPPREKEGLAAEVLRLHGAAAADPRDLTRLPVPAALTARGLALEATVDELLRRYGLEGE